MYDPGFEALPAGALVPTGTHDGWEVQRTGRDVIRDQLRAICVNDAVRAKSGNRCLELSIPGDTVGFEFVTAGQRLRLKPDAAYEASLWVRWPDGPDEPPAGASSVSGHRPPIVNYGIFHEASRTWYGPVDQILEKTGDWTTYRFVHTPAFSGRWKVYVQLNGWGNFGKGVKVSLADFTCVPLPVGSRNRDAPGLQ